MFNSVLSYFKPKKDVTIQEQKKLSMDARRNVAKFNTDITTYKKKDETYKSELANYRELDRLGDSWIPNGKLQAEYNVASKYVGTINQKRCKLKDAETKLKIREEQIEMHKKKIDEEIDVAYNKWMILELKKDIYDYQKIINEMKSDIEACKKYEDAINNWSDYLDSAHKFLEDNPELGTILNVSDLLNEDGIYFKARELIDRIQYTSLVDPNDLNKLLVFSKHFKSSTKSFQDLKGLADKHKDLQLSFGQTNMLEDSKIDDVAGTDVGVNVGVDIDTELDQAIDLVEDID
jgi:hypothetical protein